MIGHKKTALKARETKTEYESLIIAAVCAIAACRVFIFNAAFPLFNNVDEQSHFDLVYKYSNAQIPRAGVVRFSPEAGEIMLLYGTPEYSAKVGQVPPPFWTIPNIQSNPEYVKAATEWQDASKNHEAASFPLYYTMAGVWCGIGRALGITGGHLLFWIRFLNVPLFVVLVWLSYRLSRMLYPEGSPLRIGLPLLVAFFPQDAFYSINCDATSAPLFALSFLMLLQVYFEDRSTGYHLLAGLAVAATLLVKVSNAAVLALLCVMVTLKARKLIAGKEVKRHLLRLGVLVAAAAVPVALWLTRNSLVLGDITGTAEKTKHLGWTAKPLSALLNHPIFSAGGFWYFLTELTRTFWRGEFVWHLQQIAGWGADGFYVVSSIVLVAACGVGVILSRNKTDPQYRFALVTSFLMVGLSVALLAFLSLPYDFGNCWYPSRERPYFVSGRLIAGVLLPFLLLYVDGLDRICRPLGRRAVLPVIAVIAVGITLSEVWLTAEAGVFSSLYNWFYLT